MINYHKILFFQYYIEVLKSYNKYIIPIKITVRVNNYCNRKTFIVMTKLQKIVNYK